MSPSQLKRSEPLRWWILACCLGGLGFGCLGQVPETPAAPDTVNRGLRALRYTLKLAEGWRLQPPREQRFDASALLRLPDGTLLTVNDRSPTLYRISFRAAGDVADLVPVSDLWPSNWWAAAGLPKGTRLDCEGIARDDSGRLYVCEEVGRRILRFDAASSRAEVLPIDWSPVRRYFDASDANASFEGIAFGGGKLYVANERSRGRIIVVDPETYRVVRDFSVTPIDRAARDVHYTDLCWFAERLWVLCRESRCVLEVDPSNRKVVRQYDYGDIELDPAHAFLNPFPGYGFFEGLAVDETNIWLAVDNNGYGRVRDPKDRRPALFRCRRPEIEDSRQGK